MAGSITFCWKEKAKEFLEGRIGSLATISGSRTEGKGSGKGEERRDR